MRQLACFLVKLYKIYLRLTQKVLSQDRLRAIFKKEEPRKEKHMKKLLIPLMILIVLLTGCGNDDTVPAVSFTGKITDVSSLQNTGDLQAEGILSWNGEAEKDARSLTISIDSSTAITDQTGKTIKSTALKNEQNFTATFSADTKVVSPSPGKLSTAALTLKLQ